MEAKCFELEEVGVAEAGTATALVVEDIRVLDEPPEPTIDVMKTTLALLEVAELTDEPLDEVVSKVMDLRVGVVFESEGVVEVVEEVADEEAEEDEAEVEVEEPAAAPEPPPAMIGN